MTANERRQHRYDSLVRQACALRAEADRGFQDSTWQGRLLATAEEIRTSAWRLIYDCENQAEKLKEKIR